MYNIIIVKHCTLYFVDIEILDTGETYVFGIDKKEDGGYCLEYYEGGTIWIDYIKELGDSKDWECLYSYIAKPYATFKAEIFKRVPLERRKLLYIILRNINNLEIFIKNNFDKDGSYNEI